jgi:hypothetical protein
MSEQRIHSVPVKWDGQEVDWVGFEHPAGTPIICAAKPLLCPQCGTSAQPRINQGRVFNRLNIMVNSLVLQRCMSCGFTQVWDMETDKWFDLDESDYSDDGSYEEVSDE